MSAERFPHLFSEAQWRPMRVKFQMRDSLPPEDLICNVNVVPFVGEQCGVLHLRSGGWEMPGGTLEPGENYMDALTRELREEAGARLLSFTPFGAWFCHSSLPAPYRPHLPHPDFYRLVGYGDVELVSKPLNPEGAEEIASVEFVTVDEAARRFSEAGRLDLAELYMLAAHARARRPHEESLKQGGI